MPTDSDFMRMLEELLAVSRENAEEMRQYGAQIGEVATTMRGVETQVRTIATTVDRHDSTLYGREDKAGLAGRVSALESDMKRVIGAGGFVITLIVGGVVARLLNLI